MLPSGLPEIIADEEDLARFLTQSSQFTASMAKPSAFLPNPKDRETSVFRHASDPREALWEIGLSIAGERKLYGAAIVKANIVRESQLEVLSDEPPPRHAVITSWPWDAPDPEMLKARQKEIALIIASRAVLLLH
jgi:hypothetical protein